MPCFIGINGDLGITIGKFEIWSRVCAMDVEMTLT